MLCSTFLTETEERLRRHARRIRTLATELTGAQFNWKPQSQHWTIGQILEHMHLADAKYIEPLNRRIESAPYGKDREIRLTLIGTILVKGNAPTANTPAPKMLEPGKGPYDSSVARNVAAEYEEFADMVPKCQEVDLVATKFPNPFAPFIRMNLVDAFQLLVVHADRHVGQIEHMMRHENFPK